MRDWPVVKFWSGPHGRDTEVEIDGQPIHGLTRVEVEVDVMDATRVRLHQFAVVEAEMRLSPAAISYPTKVAVLVEGRGVVAESKADTIWEALHDCARQLELASHTVATGGTMAGPSGRPPGR